MENNQKYEQECTCHLEEEEPHTCPYKEEIYNDDETLCTCCAKCIQQCREDI